MKFCTKNEVFHKRVFLVNVDNSAENLADLLIFVKETLIRKSLINIYALLGPETFQEIVFTVLFGLHVN